MLDVDAFLTALYVMVADCPKEVLHKLLVRHLDWNRHNVGQDSHRVVLEVRLLLIANFERGLHFLPARLLRHYEF